MLESKKYPLISLSEVMVQDEKYITELEPRLYPKLSVRLYGRGVVLDEPTDGASVLMKRHQLAKPGQVILSEIWAKKGAIGIVPEEGAGALVTSHFFLFDIDETKLLRPYMGWLLAANYFEPVLGGEARGTTGYAAIRPRQFLACEIPLPPLAEQRRIVARIEELAALIKEARALRARAREEATVLKFHTLGHLLDECTTLRQPLGKLLAEPLLNGLSLPASQMGSGITFAKVGVVNSGRFDPNETKMADVDLAPDSPYWLKVGDILVSRGNTPELVGRAAVYEGDPPNCAMPDLLIRIRVNRELADPWFIAAFFHSSEAREYIESQATGTSPSMKKISQPKLEAMLVPDLPVDEQRRIVAYLDSLQAQVDDLTALQDTAQAELDALLPSVLDQAFRGEL